jgi:hypothetical protein
MLVLTLVAVLVLAAGSAFALTHRSGEGGSGQTGSLPGPSDLPSPTSPNRAAPAGSGDDGALSPLTGRPLASGGPGPVLAVKIDNVAPARPQTGLAKADVVYVEPVEGGLSRILAVFSAALPARVGPVRSARESDLELLAQYGRPALAFSGANAHVLAAVRAAPVLDRSPAAVPGAYHRSPTRTAPHNLFADPPALLAQAGGVSSAKDIGFTFAALPAGLGAPATSKTVRYGAARTTFTWSPARRRWGVSFDGRTAASTDGGRLGASTVVLQYTSITSSGQHDVLGNTTPYTHTVGSGRAVILRDGVAIAARWARASAEEGTTFTTTTGDPVPFAAGQVWVVYAAATSTR